MRKATDYPKLSLQERIAKNNGQRAAQRQYDPVKPRQDAHQDHRKHNSPDYNKYRSNDNKPSYPSDLRGAYGKGRSNENEEREQLRQRKEDEGKGRAEQGRGRGEEGRRGEEGKGRRARELAKNASTPSLGEQRQEVVEESQEYLKLHEKLNFIENKIADMKRHVEKKREEKQRLVEAKRERERQRQAQQRASEERQERQGGKKLDLKQLVTSFPEHKELHTFEKDPYSPKHNIYYISEIVKSYKDDKSLGREHLLTSLHIFKILENSRFATDEEMRQRQVRLVRRQGLQGKKTVIFDLDETLIHCNDTLTPPFDVKLPITFPTGEVIEAGINIRPHAQEILKNLSRYFEIIVFTASHSCYANVVLDYLDPTGEFIHHRLFREHCYQTPEGMYCKDLRVLDRDMTEMVLVDNAAYSYAAQPDNGIPILPYYHGKADFELKALERYLQQMVLAKDVRTVNRKTFQLHNYRNYYGEPERLVEELYIREEN